MSDTQGTELLVTHEIGDRPSASQHNLINRLLKRQIYGPNVTASSDGWFIKNPITPPGAGSSLVLAVMRALSVAGQTCSMQELGYSKTASKLTGEDGFKWHVTTVGAVFTVVPPPLHTYGIFNMEGALRPVAEIVEPENLSSAVCWWVDRAKNPSWAYACMIPDEDLTIVNP